MSESAKEQKDLEESIRASSITPKPGFDLNVTVLNTAYWLSWKRGSLPLPTEMVRTKRFSVKIMKSRKELQFEQLVSECIDQLTFKVNLLHGLIWF